MLTGTVIAVGVAMTLLLGIVPGALIDLLGARGSIHQVKPRRWPCPILDPELESRLPRRGWIEVEAGAPRATSRARPAFVTEAARHLMEAGGKRFRPLLVLLAAETGDPTRDGVLTSACVVELTHLASLYHDDVMDEADLRRGAESANARWDNHVAILTGDFLFSQVLGADRRPRPRRRTHPGADVHPARRGPDPARRSARRTAQDPLEHYLRVVAGKTGSLIATSARYGAMFAGAPRDVEEALTEYGEKVGVAFQLSDDILDIASRDRRVRQDPGHRPARGRADAARADRPALHRPGRRAPARAARLRPRPTTPCTPRRSPCCAAHPAMAEARAYVVAARRRGQERCSRCSPRAPCAPRSRPSPTRSPPASPERRSARAPANARGRGHHGFGYCAGTRAHRRMRAAHEGNDGDVRNAPPPPPARRRLRPAATTRRWRIRPPPPPGGGAVRLTATTAGLRSWTGLRPPAAGNNRKAVWALVLGILGLLCCGFFTGIPAISWASRRRTRSTPPAATSSGRGMATAGFVLGIIAIVWGVLYIILSTPRTEL